MHYANPDLFKPLRYLIDYLHGRHPYVHGQADNLPDCASWRTRYANAFDALEKAAANLKALQDEAANAEGQAEDRAIAELLRA